MPSSVTEEDLPMQDAPMDEEAEGPNELELEEVEMEGNRIKVMPGFSETAASFQFNGEDHTLGNALRYIIMKNPDVEFCGYSIPHPSEAKLNLRIQTWDGVNVFAVLYQALDDLMDLCDVIMDEFKNERGAICGEGTQVPTSDFVSSDTVC